MQLQQQPAAARAPVATNQSHCQRGQLGNCTATPASSLWLHVADEHRFRSAGAKGCLQANSVKPSPWCTCIGKPGAHCSSPDAAAAGLGKQQSTMLLLHPGKCPGRDRTEMPAVAAGRSVE